MLQQNSKPFDSEHVVWVMVAVCFQTTNLAYRYRWTFRGTSRTLRPFPELKSRCSYYTRISTAPECLVLQMMFRHHHDGDVGVVVVRLTRIRGDCCSSLIDSIIKSDRFAWRRRLIRFWNSLHDW